MPRKKPTDAAKIAAAAAEAAVKATRHDSTVVNLFSGNADDESEAEDVLDDLEKIDEDNGGVTWELYCDAPLDRKGQVDRIGRDELKDLRTRCLELGPGHYHVIARHGDGLFVKNSRRNIQISGLAKRSTQAVAPTAFDPQAYAAELRAQAERDRQAAKAEQREQIKFWAPILAPIGLKLAENLFGRSSGESVKDMVAALVGMKELVGGSGGDKQIETLLKGMELQREMAPADTAKGSTWPDVLVNGVTSLAKEFRPLAESLAQRKGAPAPAATPQLQIGPANPPQIAQPTSSTAAAAPATPAGGDEDMLKVFEPLLRKLASDLEDFAVNAADPQLAADALLAKIPRLIRAQLNADQVKGWLTDPQWWDVLVKFHPALAPYQGFCDEVREEVIAAVTEPEGAAEPDAGEATQ